MSVINAVPLLEAAGGGDYTIGKSVRLRQSASAYLNRTPSSASNRQTWTFSGWLKRGILTTRMSIFAGYTGTLATNLRTQIIILDGGTLQIGSDQMQTATDFVIETNQVFRDPSAWYHIVVAVDTTQATASNRVKLYVNGVQVTSFSTATYPSQNYQGGVNYNSNQYINRFYDPVNGNYYGDGYLTEINFVDGQQLTPSSFGSTNALTGVWQPAKYTGTYGTNGFYLNFSSNGSSAALGTDFSGNSNTWTVNNISVTAGATYDSMTDVPTLTSATAANYAVLNPLDVTNTGTRTIDAGNLNINTSSGAGGARSTFQLPTTGKYYFEGQYVSGTWSGNKGFGIGTSTSDISGNVIPTGCVTYNVNGQKTTGGAYSSYGSSYTTTDTVGIAVDQDAGTVTFYKNNTSQGAITHGLSVSNLFPLFVDPSSVASVQSLNFGQRPFTYTPPTGFNALNTYNLPTSTITNGAAYMAATLYTGTNANLTVTNTVNGTGMQPDLVWMKIRSTSASHVLIDSVRGVTKTVNSDLTNAESTSTGTSGLLSFNSNGFSLGTDSSATGSTNGNGNTYVGWQWQAGKGTTSSNTNGSITSTVSVGATQGFSVVTYTGTGANATVGHGLGVAPQMVITKSRNDATYGWGTYHVSTGAGNIIFLNTTAASSSAVNAWNNTAPTSSVFSIGTDQYANFSGKTYVAYCFAAVKGFSAFGSYTGNGSTDGPFVYLGFRPRWVLIKNTNVAGFNWFVWDTSRDTYNTAGDVLLPNDSGAEISGRPIDILSNGFKVRATDTHTNGNGNTMIYACFAENPFKNALAR